jgi:hypothetical protein
VLSRQCVHEAGHALVAILSGFQVDCVSKEKDEEISGNPSHGGLPKSLDLGRPVDVAAVAAAGDVAETIAFGHPESLEDLVDLDNLAATLVLEGLGGQEAIEIARKGCALAERRLRGNWKCLTVIAGKLEATGELSSDEVCDLINENKQPKASSV